MHTSDGSKIHHIQGYISSRLIRRILIYSPFVLVGDTALFASVNPMARTSGYGLGRMRITTRSS